MRSHSLRGRLAQTDTWLLEVFLGLYTLAWGLGFANPLTESFAANPAAYAILGRFPGGELLFGLTVAALGGLLLAVTLWAERPVRGFACAVAGGFWLVITVAIGSPTHWAGGGLPLFSLVTLACWYCWVRLGYRGAR